MVSNGALNVIRNSSRYTVHVRAFETARNLTGLTIIGMKVYILALVVMHVYLSHCTLLHVMLRISIKRFGFSDSHSF